VFVERCVLGRWVSPALMLQRGQIKPTYPAALLPRVHKIIMGGTQVGWKSLVLGEMAEEVGDVVFGGFGDLSYRTVTCIVFRAVWFAANPVFFCSHRLFLTQLSACQRLKWRVMQHLHECFWSEVSA
jgi:hypothetical protein